MVVRIDGMTLTLEGITLEEARLIVEAIALRRAHYERTASLRAMEATENRELLTKRCRGRVNIERIIGECEADATAHRRTARQLADLLRVADQGVERLEAATPTPAIIVEYEI